MGQMFDCIYTVSSDSIYFMMVLYVLYRILTTQNTVYLPWIKTLAAAAGFGELYSVIVAQSYFSHSYIRVLVYLSYMGLYLCVAFSVVAMCLLCRTLRSLQLVELQEGVGIGHGDPTAWPPPVGD